MFGVSYPISKYFRVALGKRRLGLILALSVEHAKNIARFRFNINPATAHKLRAKAVG